MCNSVDTSNNLAIYIYSFLGFTFSASSRRTVVGIVTVLQTGRFGVRVPVGAKGLWGLPMHWVPRLFHGSKAAGE